MIPTSLKYSLYSMFLALILASCNDNIQSSIPDYPVYLNLSLTSTYPTFRNSTNQSLTFIKGVTPNIPETNYTGFGGILVYSAPFTDDNGNTIYYAFDLSCPYEAKNNIRIHLQESSLGKVVCDKCGSVFDISFGSGLPESGPAKEAKDRLKIYRTMFSGDYLQITQQ